MTETDPVNPSLPTFRLHWTRDSDLRCCTGRLAPRRPLRQAKAAGSTADGRRQQPDGRTPLVDEPA